MFDNLAFKLVVIIVILALLGAGLGYQGLTYGIDLQGGAEITYELHSPTNELVDEDLVVSTIEVLRKRLDALAIKEMIIRPEGTDRLVIQLPGAVSGQMTEVRKMVETAGHLDFKMMVHPDSPQYALSAAEITQQIAIIERKKAAGTYYPRKETYNTAIEILTRWDAPTQRFVRTGEGKLLLRNDQAVSGDMLSDAYRTLDSFRNPAVGFEFDAEGAALFGAMTAKNVRERMSIVLDGQVSSSPVIRSQISNRGIIELGAIEQGGQQARLQREEEVKELVAILKAGSLPLDPVFQSQQVVGAALGKASIEKSKIAIMSAFSVVFLFMLVYYGTAGVVADMTLLCNLLLILGTLSLGEATLTLPGIAGIVLTAGMAVDANILVNERIREERAKGMALRQAVQNGYARAFWTIFDANITTLITALILFNAGTGPVRGFAVTLGIGIIWTLVSVLFIGRTLMATLVGNELIADLKMKRLLSETKFDFASARHSWIVVSFLAFNLLWVGFLWRGDDKYGIDFTGGNVVQIKLNKPLSRPEVEEALITAGLKDFEVQRVGNPVKSKDGEEKAYEFQIRTPETSKSLEGSSSLPDESSEKTGDSTEKLGLDDTGGGAGGAGASPQEGEEPTPADEPPAAATPAPDADEDIENAAPAVPDPAAEAEPDTAESSDEESVRDILDDDDSVTAADRAPQQAVPLAQDLIIKRMDEVLGDSLVVSYPPGENEEWKLWGFSVITDEADEDNVLVAFRVTTTTKVTQQPDGTEIISPTAETLNSAISSAGDKAGIGGDGASVEELSTSADSRYRTFEVTSGKVPVQDRKRLRARVIRPLQKTLEQAKEVNVAQPFPRIDTIGPAVASGLKAGAIKAVLLSCLAIILYITLRFEFIFGLGAVTALLHDVVITLGFLAMLDHFAPWAEAKIDLPIVAAILTILGYSVNDTIVIFDRVRENLTRKKSGESLEDVVNLSINQTLSRTVLTSVTTLLTTVALLISGVAALRGLALALTFGVMLGTYSSMFVACPVLLGKRERVYNTLMIEAGVFIALFVAVNLLI